MVWYLVKQRDDFSLSLRPRHLLPYIYVDTAALGFEAQVLVPNFLDLPFNGSFLLH